MILGNSLKQSKLYQVLEQYIYSPPSVTDGVLGLDGEEEARGVVLDGGHARHEALVGAVHGVEVAVDEGCPVPVMKCSFRDGFLSQVAIVAFLSLQKR